MVSLVVNIIGFVGLILLIVAWLPETIDVIKKGKVMMPYSFLILYLIGVISLAIYSVILKDLVFSILNILLIFEAAINLYYKRYPRHK